MTASNSQNPPIDSEMVLRCDVVPIADTERWSEIRAKLTPFTDFYCSTWARLLRECYKFTPYVIVCESASSIEGILPFAEVNSLLTGKRGISLPFIDVCSAFTRCKEAFAAMYERMKEFGRTQNWSYLELRDSAEQLEGINPSIEFYSHTINLEGTASELFERLKPNVQRAIRKAKKSGVEVVRSNDEEALNNFYLLQCRTRKRHGLPPQPKEFFESLKDLVLNGGESSISTAYFDGKPASSCVYIVQDESTVHYKYGASDYDLQNTRANNLVMWLAIEHYSKLGYKNLELGRNSIDSQEGLRRYKLSWGSKESILRYHRFNFKSNKTEKMSDRAFGAHNAVFSRLPISLGQIVGKYIYRHIA